MKKPVHVPRTANEATKKGHRKIPKRLETAVARARSAHLGANISASNAKPGDVAWVGPCEASGTRVVCYYDQNMNPSDCRNQPC
jgi:hypothetical protein